MACVQIPAANRSRCDAADRGRSPRRSAALPLPASPPPSPALCVRVIVSNHIAGHSEYCWLVFVCMRQTTQNVTRKRTGLTIREHTHKKRSQCSNQRGYMITDPQTHKHTSTQTNKQTKHTNTQTHKHTNKTHKHTNTYPAEYREWTSRPWRCPSCCASTNCAALDRWREFNGQFSLLRRRKA